MKYFKPNWAAINKSIAAGELTELRREERHIKETIQSKIDIHYKNKRLAETLAKISALRDLPRDTEVFYIGRSQIPFGSAAIKLKDGRKYMEVSINGKGWLVPYTHIKIAPPTPEEITSNKVTSRLNSFLQKL